MGASQEQICGTCGASYNSFKHKFPICERCLIKCKSWIHRIGYGPKQNNNSVSKIILTDVLIDKWIARHLKSQTDKYKLIKIVGRCEAISINGGRQCKSEATKVKLNKKLCNRHFKMKNLKSEDGKLCYSVQEVADICSLSRAFIFDKISSGELVSFKIASRRLIHFSDLEKWINFYRNNCVIDDSKKPEISGLVG